MKLRDRVLREETARPSIARETARPSIERREKKVSRGRKKCKASRGQKERKARRHKGQKRGMPEGTKARSKAYQKARKPEVRYTRKLEEGQKAALPAGAEKTT